VARTAATFESKRGRPRVTEPSFIWRNWTGDLICSPAAFERPVTTEDVAAAVGRAAERDWTVRVAGSGHSFTDAVPTDGLILSLERMDRVLDLDRGAGLVRVQAGVTLNALNRALAAGGVALPNMGDVDVQSVAGATATGTHGTGARLANLSAGIHSLELVLADGSVTEINEDVDPDAWRAARIGIGSLGVVTEVVLKVGEAFTLRGTDERRPLDDVLDRIDEIVDSNDHFEFLSFPHSGLVHARTNNRVDEPPRPRSRAGAWANDVLMTNHLFGVACRLGRRWPSWIPAINRTVTRLGGKSSRVDRSDRILTTPRSVRFTEMEYALPRARGAEAVRAVHGVVKERGFAVPFPMEVRFVALDDAFLSPANGRDTCYVAVHMFEGMPWEPYFRAVEEIMDGFEGRPHWGKRHFQTADTLRPRYPDWHRFAAVRARLDPGGRFTNDYVRRVLGPPALFC
jgi:L-gulono-1,4-lactone dehydrogenase